MRLFSVISRTLIAEDGLSNLGRQPVSEKENFEFKQVVLFLKIDIVPDPACGRGFK